jgi:hypothetical protein
MRAHDAELERLAVAGKLLVEKLVHVARVGLLGAFDGEGVDHFVEGMLGVQVHGRRLRCRNLHRSVSGRWSRRLGNGRVSGNDLRIDLQPYEAAQREHDPEDEQAGEFGLHG